MLGFAAYLLILIIMAEERPGGGADEEPSQPTGAVGPATLDTSAETYFPDSIGEMLLEYRRNQNLTNENFTSEEIRRRSLGNLQAAECLVRLLEMNPKGILDREVEPSQLLLIERALEQVVTIDDPESEYIIDYGRLVTLAANLVTILSTRPAAAPELETDSDREVQILLRLIREQAVMAGKDPAAAERLAVLKLGKRLSEDS
jgi:hypothetical protein